MKHSTSQRFRLPFRIPRSALAFVCGLALLSASAAADTILDTFLGTPDGAHSKSPLVADMYGNLYGTTVKGGANNLGSVFVMCAPNAPAPDIPQCLPGQPNWVYGGVLYSFQGILFSDGSSPEGGLVFGGNYAGRKFTLYGTTYYGGGGAYPSCMAAAGDGCGTVFELCAPSSLGGCSTDPVNWQEHVLWRFSGLKDGAYPYAGPIVDKFNNLYGTTVYGGTMGHCYIGSTNWYCGTVFKMKHPTTTNWTFSEVIMHRFKGAPADGANPYGVLAINPNFTTVYGTTLRGGNGSWNANSGTVFQVQTTSPYASTVLYNFCNLGGCWDGANPVAGITFDNTSNIYGTAEYGGQYGEGVVYELAASSYTTESLVYTFCYYGGVCPDGAVPIGGLTLDSSGKIYGTTDLGGVGHGTVFELAPPVAPGGAMILWNFTGGPGDGDGPYSGVTFDPIVDGRLYGATPYGGTALGTSGLGIVYSQP